MAWGECNKSLEAKAVLDIFVAKSYTFENSILERSSSRRRTYSRELLKSVFKHSSLIMLQGDI